MMNTYKHPALNSAIAINATSDCLYILQNMAPHDIHGLMRDVQLKNDTSLTTYQIKNILYRVSKGISYLHSKGLVHGDIKCSNVLYYSDTDIKITDFNLTTIKKWKSNIHLCTAIYRPYEIWASKDWSEKIDIWAFGCMMYELLYGKLLFPYQGEPMGNNRRLTKHKYINTIIDWGFFNSPGKLKVGKYNISYTHLEIPVELREYSASNKNLEFDYNRNRYINLMLRCLQVLDHDRPHIDTIISDQYFTEMRSNPTMRTLFNVVEQKPRINKDFYNTIERNMRDYAGQNDKELLKLATDICYHYIQIKGCDTHLARRVSVWIAKKLLRVDAKSQEIPGIEDAKEREKFLQKEIEICNTLHFRLHYF